MQGYLWGSYKSTLCAGGLNIEGKQVDACLGNGAACGQPAADAFCKYIGFDGAAADQYETGPADEPARAVSGVPPTLLWNVPYSLFPVGSMQFIHMCWQPCNCIVMCGAGDACWLLLLV